MRKQKRNKPTRMWINKYEAYLILLQETKNRDLNTLKHRIFKIFPDFEFNKEIKK